MVSHKRDRRVGPPLLPRTAPRLVRCAWLLAWALCAALSAQDFSSRNRTAEGQAAPLTPLDKAYLLKLARHALYSEGRPAGDVPPNCLRGAGREAFLSLYGPNGVSLRMRAAGSSLADSVAHAAVEARVDPAFVKSGFAKAEDVRVKVDVLSGQDLIFPHPSLNLVLEMAPALDGLAARKGDAQGYVLPAEIIARQITGRTRLLEAACEDAGLPADAWRSLNTEISRIRTISFMERRPGGADGGYLEPYRAVPLVGQLTPAALDAAALAAGKWLASTLDEDGSFASSYSPFDGQYERKVYSMGRHTEATLSLLQLCAKTKDPALIAAAQKAVAFLCKHIVPADAPGKFSFIHEDIHGKLGPAALATLALLERRAATGEKDHDADITQLGFFLCYMQKEDGSFYPIYEFKKRVKREDPAYRYYPGQALLAVVRLYRQTKDEKLLKVALNGAEHIIHQRDALLKRTEPLEDPWAAQALVELYLVAEDLSHAEYCLNIAETIRLHQFGREGTAFLDYVGGADQDTDTGNPPSVSVTAARLQAMNAAVSLAVKMNTASDGYRRSAQDMARFVLQNQFTPENSYYIPHPGKVLGGFRSNFIEPKIELECVARALSALLAVDCK